VRYWLPLVALLVLPAHAFAANRSDDTSNGIWVSTPYPTLRVSAEELIKLPLSVHNSAPKAERVKLSVVEAPAGWKTSLLGGGREIGAVIVDPKGERDLDLQVTPDGHAKAGTYDLKIQGKAGTQSYMLPVELELGAKPPAKITLNPEFPDIRGGPKSEFTYKIKLKNTGRAALVGLDAQTPPGFQASFSKQYGKQDITSIPVKASDTENIEVKIKPPQGAKADTYKIRVVARDEDATAATDLKMTVTGRPAISLTGKNGLISGDATAGKTSQIKLVVANTGTAPASEIRLSSSEPSDWKVNFDQKKIAMLKPGDFREVAANITPSAKAIAGDYMVTMSASGDGVTSSTDYRVTVDTSTLWGAVGIAIIAAALLAMVGAMVRFGRR
jgi:uncharacterized membrane protein